jgi:hypothetical protein
MKFHERYPDPPPMLEDEARKILEVFRDRSLDKGYLYLGIDFEKLMEAVWWATVWYDDKPK